MRPVRGVPQSDACSNSEPPDQLITNTSLYLYPQTDCIAKQAGRADAKQAAYIIWSSQKRILIPVAASSPPVVFVLDKDILKMEEVSDFIPGYFLGNESKF